MSSIQYKLHSSELRCFKNVTNYSYTEDPLFQWKIQYEIEEFPENTSVPIYFILDSANNSAFSHWVYENATWLPYFLEIQKKYPSCFLVLESIKEYKYMFVSFYGISLGSIRLRSEISTSNFCFFHTYFKRNFFSTF